MKIIIIGSGKVGYTLAAQLVAEDHDLIIIDNKMTALQHADDTLDVMCIRGNGASISVLLEAGVREADLVISVTDSDEVNTICCLLAKKLGAQHTVARIRNPAHATDSELLRQETGLDLVINPELAAAQEISRILRFPFASHVDSFSRSRVEMVGFRSLPEDKLANIPLYELVKDFSANMLFCAVKRDGQVYVPDGSFVMQPHDEIYVLGEHMELNRFFKTLGRTALKIKDIIIVGGGRISVYLAWAMEKAGVGVRIIEMDEDICASLSEMLPDAMMIHGDGTETALLESESFTATDAFISLTNRDEENLLSALYAQRSGVPKVIAKITRQNYAEMAKDLGLDSVISPKNITANRILRYVRGLNNSKSNAMQTLYKLLDGSIEVTEFVVTDTTKNINTALRDLRLKKGIIIGVIMRGSEIIIPHGNDEFHLGDRVILIAQALHIFDLNDIFN